MTPITGIVFDKDGTLFDFSATWGNWCQRFIATMSGGDFALRNKLAKVLGFDPETAQFAADAIVIAQTNAEIAVQLQTALPHLTVVEILARMDALAAGMAQVEAAPLRPLLAELQRRGLKLGVATNDSEASARAHLAAAQIDQLFDFIAGYDSGYGGKPAPGPLLAFASICACDPAQCLMVGDSVHDLVAGRAAGMTTIGVLTGIAGRDDLSPYADVVLGSVAELPDWLDTRGQNRD